MGFFSKLKFSKSTNKPYGVLKKVRLVNRKPLRASMKLREKNESKQQKREDKRLLKKEKSFLKIEREQYNKVSKERLNQKRKSFGLMEF